MRNQNKYISFKMKFLSDEERRKGMENARKYNFLCWSFPWKWREGRKTLSSCLNVCIKIAENEINCRKLYWISFTYPRDFHLLFLSFFFASSIDFPLENLREEKVFITSIVQRSWKQYKNFIMCERKKTDMEFLRFFCIIICSSHRHT